MRLWLLVLIMGAGTYAIRLSMLVFVKPGSVPPSVRAALAFILPAVLGAIILPAIVYTGGTGGFDAGFGNARVPAALGAAAIARATRSVWATIIVGMGLLWLLNWLF